MTGRPGHRTMEMDGRSTVSYLVRTPRVPVFMLIVLGLEAKGLLAFQGRRGSLQCIFWGYFRTTRKVKIIFRGNLEDRNVLK